MCHFSLLLPKCHLRWSHLLSYKIVLSRNIFNLNFLIMAITLQLRYNFLHRFNLSSLISYLLTRLFNYILLWVQLTLEHFLLLLQELLWFILILQLSHCTISIIIDRISLFIWETEYLWAWIWWLVDILFWLWPSNLLLLKLFMLIYLIVIRLLIVFS